MSGGSLHRQPAGLLQTTGSDTVYCTAAGNSALHGDTRGTKRGAAEYSGGVCGLPEEVMSIWAGGGAGGAAGAGFLVAVLLVVEVVVLVKEIGFTFS